MCTITHNRRFIILIKSFFFFLTAAAIAQVSRCVWPGEELTCSRTAALRGASSCSMLTRMKIEFEWNESLLLLWPAVDLFRTEMFSIFRFIQARAEAVAEGGGGDPDIGRRGGACSCALWNWGFCCISQKKSSLRLVQTWAVRSNKCRINSQKEPDEHIL